MELAEGRSASDEQGPIFVDRNDGGSAASASCSGSSCCKRGRGGAESDLSHTAFRLAEKRYKLYQVNRREARRTPATTTTATHSSDAFRDLVHFDDLGSNTETNQSMIHQVEVADDPSVTCYTFSGVPGLLIFPQALSEAEQVAYCRDAILDYGDSRRHPNILSTHAKLPRSTEMYQPPMRWATLGFSYQWTSKTYDKALYSSFPNTLRHKMQRLMAHVATVRQDAWHIPSPDAYQPQTAIVNYYPVGSMMMCHQDISEEVLDQPLVSVSLGCSAVFLMGTDSRHDAPYAFLLRSGDVAAFTGPARTAFHATPRILDDCPSYLTVPSESLTPAETARFAHHAYYHHPSPDGGMVRVEKDAMSHTEKERYWRLCMRHMRININARQVYAENCDFVVHEDTS